MQKKKWRIVYSAVHWSAQLSNKANKLDLLEKIGKKANS